MAEVHDGATLRAALLEIAGDFSFTWIAEARLLFDALDPRRFAELHHNPTALLSELTDEDLARALTPDYLERLARVQARLARDRGEETWWRSRNLPSDLLVAYFSAEFGLDESLPIYSGGLGVLAGDYLKSASELGIPLVGIGLFYRHGYFRQQLDEHDWQTEHYPLNDSRPGCRSSSCRWRPSSSSPDDDGELVPVRLGVWRATSGASPSTSSTPTSRGTRTGPITDTLYGGDRANRLRQEVVLGVGGVRVLRGLGLEPTVFHLNEGHSAFLQLERMRELVEEQGLSTDEAIERLRASTVFTTHTPVPGRERGLRSRARAGEPRRPRRALRPRVGGVPRARQGRAERQAASGSRRSRSARRSTRTASRSSTARSRARCGTGSGRRRASTRFRSPRSRTASTSGRGSPASSTACSATRTRSSSARASSAADDLWAAHRGAKERLLRFIVDTRGARELDPDVLTIGFARRFATYKRASLLFSRPERLAQLLADPERPIQVLVAGKAHPADEGGKELIQLVVDFAREPTAAGRVVFLEDYEMTLARRLVQGVDVWLNTPRRPLEASGTSGMKAALNGVVNCSILDGWWAEAYSPACGLRDRRPGGRADEAEQDEADAEALFAVLEEQVLPAYYERDEAGLPQRWIALMRESIARARAAVQHGPDGGGVRRAALPPGARGRTGPKRAAWPEESWRRADPEARLPPLPSGGRSRRPHALGRAEQDEEARAQRPERHAEDQAEPADRADEEHDRDEAGEGGPPAREDPRPPGEDRDRGERQDRGHLRADEEDVDGVMEDRGGRRGRCRSCRFRRRGRRPQ